MYSINTNLSSIISQRSLSRSTTKLNTAIERMSTGFKINHAKDNAAGYSISTNMSTKISSYGVAEDNVSQGLDLLSTASDSLSLISNALSRLRSLQEQALNGTYGSDSLSSINSEANALIDEIERIYNSTEYGGKKILGHTSQFIKEIDERDTSKMTSLSEVDESQKITSGEYSISTAEELAKLGRMADKALIQGGEFVLSNDIDLKEYENWNPIGENHWSDNCFKGVFDGNGHVIYNLKINSTSSRTGLFASIVGTVKNLGVEGAEITSGGSVGIICGTGYQDPTIENCYATGKINNTGSMTGGIVGWIGGNEAKILD